MATFNLYVDNDMNFEIQELKDAVLNTFQNSATVTLTSIRDTSSNEIALGGASYPVTLAYVAASNGKYRGTVPNSLAALPNTAYKGFITIDAGSGFYGEFITDLNAINRAF